MSSTAALRGTPSLTTATHVRRTQSCEACGAIDARVTYEWTDAGVESSPGLLITASCTNEECQWFDRRTKRREYANEAVARLAATAA